MPTLPNFSHDFRNQLAPIGPSDGRPDENEFENCGPNCLSAIIQFLTGKVIAPDDVKDAVYGQGYTGPTAIPAFEGYLATLGIHVEQVWGSPTGLLQAVMAGIDRGEPSIICIPSRWGKEPPDPPGVGFLHFVDPYSYDANGITCMNPWGGFAHTGTEAYWRERLRLGTIWRFTRMPVPTGWKDDGKTLVAPNGKPVVKGFRDHILNSPWNPNLVPVDAEYATSANSSRQDFTLSTVWSAARGIGETTGPDWKGAMKAKDDKLVVLEAQLEAAAKQIANLNQQLAASANAAAIIADIKDIEAKIKS